MKKSINDLACLSAWYCTKDRGFYDETGKIFVIADTFKHYIRYKNVILLPEILETMIHRHPAVSEVIVVAVKDPIDFQHPRAYVKIRSGAKVQSSFSPFFLW